MELNYCDVCCVYVDGSLKRCPLCGKTLTSHPEGETMYPPVKRKRYIDRGTLRDDRYFYLAFIAIGSAALLNIIFWNGVPWFLAVLTVVVNLWVLLRVTIMSDLFAGTKALCQMAALFAMFFSFDYMDGLRGWSYTYVLPFILGLGTAYIDFYAYFHKPRWRDNLVYAILFLVLGFIPLILYLTGVTSVFWPMALCALASILTILGILKFTIKYLRAELAKRLHM